MPVTSRMELVAVLARQDHDTVLGTAESEWLDFKKEPYRLNENGGRWELAKDVASFANKGGGYILVGVRTVKRESELGDVATSVTKIPKKLVDGGQHQDVVESWIYPRVRDVRLQWFPPEPDADRGLLLIEVPPQNEQDKLFVVRRMLDEGKESGAVGVPVREGDRSEWIRAETVHHYLARGYAASRDPTTGAVLGISEDLSAQLSAAIADIEELQGWRETPLYVLQAIPPDTGERFQDFYLREGIRAALRNPDELRNSGFNLNTGAPVEVIEGAFSIRDSWQAQRLERNGILTVVCESTPGWLGHAINEGRSESDPMKINPIALVEYTFEFARFVHRELAPKVSPGRWSFHVRCLRFKSNHIALGRGLNYRAPGPWGESRASSDDWSAEVESDGRAAYDAFGLLRETYALFGLGEDAIPLSADGRVDAQAIQEVR